jgi:ATP-dependent Clp protease adaptor protein ClpS
VSDPIRTEPGTTTLPEIDESIEPKLLPPYNLILENDEYHSFEFVIMVLCKALGYSVEKSYQYTLEAHNSGQAIVWTGSKEVAELKLEQVLTFHEERTDGRKFGPLQCRIEPAS